MSFSGDVKAELCTVQPEKDCCRLTELGALYRTIGSLSFLGRGNVNVQLTSESMAVCRRAYTLLTKALRITPQIHYVTHARFGGTRKCVLTLGPVHSPAFLQAMGMMERGEGGGWTMKATAPKQSLSRQCCTRAFLRGVMLGAGTMMNPELGYHLELGYRDEDTRADVAKCLQRVGVSIKQSARDKGAFLYVKQSDQVVAFLSAVGAHQAVMRIEELRVKRQVFGSITRAMNCDAANLQKQMNASDEQITAIRRLMESGELEHLSPSLQQMAQARLDAPDATLEQLGQMMEPPIGKSGVNHRMRRLMAIAQEL